MNAVDLVKLLKKAKLIKVLTTRSVGRRKIRPIVRFRVRRTLEGTSQSSSVAVDRYVTDWTKML